MPKTAKNMVRRTRESPMQQDLFVAWEVQQRFQGGHWENVWSEVDGKGNEVPTVFASREEARAELDEFLRDVVDAVTKGDMEGVYDREDFRVVPVVRAVAMQSSTSEGRTMKITMSRSQWERMGKTAGWMEQQPPKKLDPELRSDPRGGMHDIYPRGGKSFSEHQFNPAEYTYHINLNERGSFYADVRNSAGKTVFTIKAGDELAPDESSVFEDGFMRDIHDMKGLREHLVDVGIMNEGQTLRDVQPRER